MSHLITQTEERKNHAVTVSSQNTQRAICSSAGKMMVTTVTKAHFSAKNKKKHAMQYHWFSSVLNVTSLFKQVSRF